MISKFILFKNQIIKIRIKKAEQFQNKETKLKKDPVVRNFLKEIKLFSKSLIKLKRQKIIRKILVKKIYNWRFHNSNKQYFRIISKINPKIMLNKIKRN